MCSIGCWAAGPSGATDPFVVVVNCAEPGGTCFCVSMGTGPALQGEGLDSADLVLWERRQVGSPEYLVTHSSDRGARLLAGVRFSGCGPVRPVAGPRTPNATHRSAWDVDSTPTGLAERLMATLDSPRWDDVAARCLSCGNCTMVCPTCFCSSVHDDSALDGSKVSRIQRWDSCFSLEHSFVHGGSVRSRHARNGTASG